MTSLASQYALSKLAEDDDRKFDDGVQSAIKSLTARKSEQIKLSHFAVNYVKSFPRPRLLKTPISTKSGGEGSAESRASIIQSCHQNFTTRLAELCKQQHKTRYERILLMKALYRGSLFLADRVSTKIIVRSEPFQYGSGWYVEYGGAKLGSESTESGTSGALHTTACEFFEMCCLACHSEVARNACKGDETFLVTGLLRYNSLYFSAQPGGNMRSSAEVVTSSSQSSELESGVGEVLDAGSKLRVSDFVQPVVTSDLSNFMFLNLAPSAASTILSTKEQQLTTAWRRIYAGYLAAGRVFFADTIHFQSYNLPLLGYIDESTLVALHCLAASAAGIAKIVYHTSQPEQVAGVVELMATAREIGLTVEDIMEGLLGAPDFPSFTRALPALRNRMRKTVEPSPSRPSSAKSQASSPQVQVHGEKLVSAMSTVSLNDTHPQMSPGGKAMRTFTSPPISPLKDSMSPSRGVKWRDELRKLSPSRQQLQRRGSQLPQFVADVDSTSEEAGSDDERDGVVGAVPTKMSALGKLLAVASFVQSGGSSQDPQQQQRSISEAPQPFFADHQYSKFLSSPVSRKQRDEHGYVLPRSRSVQHTRGFSPSTLTLRDLPMPRRGDTVSPFFAIVQDSAKITTLRPSTVSVGGSRSTPGSPLTPQTSKSFSLSMGSPSPTATRERMIPMRASPSAGSPGYVRPSVSVPIYADHVKLAGGSPTSYSPTAVMGGIRYKSPGFQQGKRESPKFSVVNMVATQSPTAMSTSTGGRGGSPDPSHRYAHEGPVGNFSPSGSNPISGVVGSRPSTTPSQQQRRPISGGSILYEESSFAPFPARTVKTSSRSAAGGVRLSPDALRAYEETFGQLAQEGEMLSSDEEESAVASAYGSPQQKEKKHSVRWTEQAAPPPSQERSSVGAEALLYLQQQSPDAGLPTIGSLPRPHSAPRVASSASLLAMQKSRGTIGMTQVHFVPYTGSSTDAKQHSSAVYSHSDQQQSHTSSPTKPSHQ